VFEPDPIKRIVQLDVHAEVVAVELKFVPGAQAAFLSNVERESGDGAINTQLPMEVLTGVGTVINSWG
jgi:hypothetical protein